MIVAPVDKTTYTVLHSVTNHQHEPTVLSQVQPLSPSTELRLNHECIQYTTEEVTIKFKHCQCLQAPCRPRITTVPKSSSSNIAAIGMFTACGSRALHTEAWLNDRHMDVANQLFTSSTHICRWPARHNSSGKQGFHSPAVRVCTDNHYQVLGRMR